MPSSNSSAASASSSMLPLIILTSAAAGAALTCLAQKIIAAKIKATKDPETNHQLTSGLVWSSIGGAMQAAMLYTGDRLGLYGTLRELCGTDPQSYVTAVELAEATGLNQRWLREWLGSQVATGLLKLQPGSNDDDASLFYRLPAAAANVLANPDSTHYDIAMVQMVPALVHRAKTMLPDAFRTGIGRPYDDKDVAQAINRSHAIHVRDVFVPHVLQPCLDGTVHAQLQAGITVADLGCGAGTLLLSLAKQYPNSTFHGYEISTVALETAAYDLAKSRMKNVYFHNANMEGDALGDCTDEYDLVVVLDVLHDSTDPADLIRQVKTAIKPQGVWLLADIPAGETMRENVASGAGTYFGFSICLCLSCSLSEEGGAGLGTLGLSISVAKKLLKEGGFDSVEVLYENPSTRWFLVQ